ncbi:MULTISPECIES: hypothetical protein [Burkholderia cepacia complex]|uniref:hypothetical protein n=1 Tax=Burkholderia cepacia complex TaxID=87882 RepID=UPI000F5A4B55|nr:hypothetical protein [Burkholderia cenocepacia]MBR8509186.1 hypothetical protein [Burkholderia cenocepacia]
MASQTGKTEALLDVYPPGHFVDKNGAYPGENRVGVDEKYGPLVAHLHKEKGGEPRLSIDRAGAGISRDADSPTA